MLPFPPRVFAKEYLAINPLGTIPLMIDGDTKMTESSGICHYLGTTYGPTPLMVGVEEPAYGAFLNWMYFSDATLTFPQTLVLRYTQLEPEERRSPQVATDYAKWFLGRLRAVEAATATSETLCAGRFTAADIVIGYALRLADSIGLSKDFGPNVNAYWERLQAREGYQRALAAEQRAGVEQNVAPRVRAVISGNVIPGRAKHEPGISDSPMRNCASEVRASDRPGMTASPGTKSALWSTNRSGRRAACGGSTMDATNVDAERPNPAI